jgi:hypothetical protein
MPMNRLLPILLCLLPAFPAVAKGPPQALPNWPCDTPIAGPLEADMLWPGMTAQAADALKDDPDAQRLAELIAATETPPGVGEREIASFAQKNGPLKPERAQRIVAAMVERGNALRRILLDGIKEQVARSRTLADAVADDNAKIAAAEQADGGAPVQVADAGGNPAPQPAGPSPAALRETLRQHLTQLEGADAVAQDLCRRLVFDERKLRRLAAALKARAQ